MKLLTSSVAGLICVCSVHAQTNSLPLWPNGAPGALGTEPKDIPTLSAFLPESARATGSAIVICPGGAYQHLADHEGSVYAQWLNDRGVAAFVLKYRLGNAGYRHPAMLQDAARAVRTVRARAAEWQLDTNRVGIMGSSAGGHLASTLLTHFDSGRSGAEDPVERQSSRPDFGILCYPVITLGEFTHAGSRRNLLGTNPPPELVAQLSNELQVTSNTPPCFIWSTGEDRTVPVENTLQFAAALRKAGVSFDLHVYEKGPHGIGLGIRQYTPEQLQAVHPWTRDLEFWLRQRGYAR
jgi:acetyl esterase/lipase